MSRLAGGGRVLFDVDDVELAEAPVTGAGLAGVGLELFVAGDSKARLDRDDVERLVESSIDWLETRGVRRWEERAT